MTGKKMIVILAAAMGCASMRPASSGDLAAGHWSGQIDRDGWMQPLSFDIENDDGTYRGEWRAADGIASEPLKKVDVSGDTVRLETDKLLFVGRIQCSRLAGTVSHKGTDGAQGEFSVIHDEVEHNPGSEPVFGENTVSPDGFCV